LRKRSSPGDEDIDECSGNNIAEENAGRVLALSSETARSNRYLKFAN